MSEERMLWCLIQGESTPFMVTAPVDINIFQLKELVREKGIDSTKTSVLAKDLILWKVFRVLCKLCVCTI